MHKTVYDVVKAATIRQAVVFVAASLAVMGTGLVTVGRSAADYGVRHLPAWDSLSRKVAQLDSIQRADRTRADSVQNIDIRFKAAMLETNPALREQVKAQTDSSAAAARRQAENLELLQRLGGLR